MIDRRRETRTAGNVSLLVWGVDNRGAYFRQQVLAREVSLRGALLFGLDIEIMPGDMVGILYAGKKARFRVIWVHHAETGEKIQAAVHRVEADACPWLEVLSNQPSALSYQPSVSR